VVIMTDDGESAVRRLNDDLLRQAADKETHDG
jgi:hypothetical protein